MNFYFAPSPSIHLQALERVQAFNQNNLSPLVIEDDKTKTFRKSLFLNLKKEGLTSLLMPRTWGGQELNSATYYTVLRELAKTSASYSITVGVHQMIQAALLTFGSNDQKNRFLKDLVGGETLGAFSLSESSSGSDAASLKTTAQKVSGGYLLNGTKLWCSNGADADLFLVMARTGGPGPQGISAFLVPANSTGFSIGKKETKLGLNHSSLTELVLEHCFLPEDLRLGKEGEGFKIALSQLDAGRLGIAATALGLAQRALETVYCSNHPSVQGSLCEGVQFEWAHYYARLQAVLLLVEKASELKDQGEKITLLASQSKLLASDLAMEMTSQAVTDLGWEAVNTENGIERMMRDAKALQIVEGTNQIQKLVLSRELAKIGAACRSL